MQQTKVVEFYKLY